MPPPGSAARRRSERDQGEDEGRDRHPTQLARRTLRRHVAEVLEAGIVIVTGIADTSSNKDDFLSRFGYAMTRSSITERTLSVNLLVFRAPWQR